MTSQNDQAAPEAADENDVRAAQTDRSDTRTAQTDRNDTQADDNAGDPDRQQADKVVVVRRRRRPSGGRA
jgi:hypothetical protein